MAASKSNSQTPTKPKADLTAAKPSEPSDPDLAPPGDDKGDQPLPEDSPGSLFIQKLVTGEIANPEKDKGGKGKKPAAPAGEDEDDAGDDKGGDEHPSKPSAAKRKSAPKPAPARQIDEQALGEAVGRAVAIHFKPTGKEPADDGAKPGDDLTPGQKKRLEVFQHLEKINGDRYAGIAEKFKENTTKLRNYAAQWEKDHPGQDFNEDDAEHADFLEELNAAVDYDEDEYDEARIDLLAEKKLAQSPDLKEMRQTLDGVKRAERAQAAADATQQFGLEAGTEFWKDMGGDFAAVIDAESGQISKEQVAALKKADPVAFKIVSGAAAAAELAARAVYMLENDLAEFDGKDDLHRFLTGFLTAKEAAMMKRSEDDREHDGRQFAPRTEYVKMTKAQRERHWTFDADDLRLMLRKHFARIAKEELAEEDQKFSARAKAKGLIEDDDETPDADGARRAAAGKTAGNRVVTPQGGGDDDDDDDEDKPSSPTAPSSPKLAAGKGGKGDANLTAAERFQRKFLA